MTDQVQDLDVEKRDDEKPLTTPEFQELVNFITANQIVTPCYSHGQYADLLARYATKYSLPAMYRFMVWALQNGLPSIKIMSTIGHDLGGFINQERCFSPRSESY